MPCLLRHSSTLSLFAAAPSPLDLPYSNARSFKKVSFPCPHASPDLFASHHSTWSSSEYDRTPIEPPSVEERACALPRRGERCFGSDEDDSGDEDNDDAPCEEVIDELSPCGLFLTRTLDAGEESDREEDYSTPFPVSASPSNRRRTPRPISTPKHSLESITSDSSPASPTTARRILWLQSQADSLPSALRSRLLLLASVSDSPPPTPGCDLPIFESPVATSQPFAFGAFRNLELVHGDQDGGDALSSTLTDRPPILGRLLTPQHSYSTSPPPVSPFSTQPFPSSTPTATPPLSALPSFPFPFSRPASPHGPFPISRHGSTSSAASSSDETMTTTSTSSSFTHLHSPTCSSSDDAGLSSDASADTSLASLMDDVWPPPPGLAKGGGGHEQQGEDEPSWDWSGTITRRFLSTTATFDPRWRS